MPDSSLMVTFKQATMPAQGLLPKDQLAIRNPKTRIYSGLDLANIYLRSTDGGRTWVKVAEERFHGPSDRPVWSGSHCALASGAILRAVDGSALPLSDLPRQIFLQRSPDRGRSWGSPEIPPEPTRPVGFEKYLGDFGDCITRIRRLRDGRVLATGVKRFDPNAKQRVFGEPVMLISADDGVTWKPQRFVLDGVHSKTTPGAWDEWDCAELPGGDFLGVFRRDNPAKPSQQVRYQGRLHRPGDMWVLDRYVPAPFPHSGHPELLATREGPILHIATSGIHWTTDAGASWHELKFGGKASYRSGYYPRSVQIADGTICVIGHTGGDNCYGQVDQSIILDRFRLEDAR